MNTFLLDYIPIIIFLGIAIGMASLIMIASWIVAKQNPDEEKLSPMNVALTLLKIPGHNSMLDFI